MSLSDKQLTRRIRAPFLSVLGSLRQRFDRDAWESDYVQRAFTPDGTDMTDLYGTDALGNLLVGGGVKTPATTSVRLQLAANSKIATINPFFVNNNDTTPLEIVGISCIYGTAASVASTGTLVKDPVGSVPGGGSACMTGTFNLNTTTNTLQNATLMGVRGSAPLVIGPGEQLTFLVSAVSALAGLSVTVYLRPHTGVSIASYSRHANADIATATTIYLNVIPGLTVRSVAMRWGVAATDATMTAAITKDVPTDAPGAGTATILSAAQSIKGTVNTTVYPALSATAANLKMAAGDRLALKLTGAPTATTDLVVTVFFSAGPEQHFVVPVSLWDGAATDRTMYISDGYYVVSDCWETWSTISTSITHLLTKDTGATAAGAGTALQTDNTNAGILTSGTLNTPVGSSFNLTNRPSLWLSPGDRLGLKNGGSASGLAGVFAAILLRRA
jgi:hypothetical protein